MDFRLDRTYTERSEWEREKEKDGFTLAFRFAHNQLHNYIPKIIEIIGNYVIGSLRPAIEISNL